MRSTRQSRGRTQIEQYTEHNLFNSNYLFSCVSPAVHGSNARHSNSGSVCSLSGCCCLLSNSSKTVFSLWPSSLVNSSSDSVRSLLFCLISAVSCRECTVCELSCLSKLAGNRLAHSRLTALSCSSLSLLEV